MLLYWHEFCIPLWLGSNSWHQQNRRHQFKIAGPSGPPQKIEKPNRKFYCKTHTHTHSQAARTCKQLTYWNVVKWCRPWKLQSSLEPNYQQYIKLPLEKYNHTYIINSHPHSCDVTNAYSISWLVHPTQCTMSHNFNFWKIWEMRKIHLFRNWMRSPWLPTVYINDLGIKGLDFWQPADRFTCNLSSRTAPRKRLKSASTWR